MSNFNQLKNMWQNKANTKTTAPQPPPLKKPSVQQKKSTTPTIPQQSNQPLSKTSSDVQKPKQAISVSQLKSNLQGKMIFGMKKPLSYQANQNHININKPPSLQEQNQNQSKAVHSQTIKQQAIPTVRQTKAKLQQFYQKKAAEQAKAAQKQKEAKEHPHSTIAPTTQNQTHISIKKQQQSSISQNLTPQQRTSLIIQRIFPQTRSTTHPSQNQNPQKSTIQPIIHKQQQTVTLNVRNKKQKRSLQNFDDA